MNILIWTFGIVISLMASFLFYYLKSGSKNKNTSKIARYSPLFVGSGWLWWTVAGSAIVLGYPITGALFNYQIVLILVAFGVLYFIAKLFEKKDSTIFDLKNALKDG